jgi:2-keto-4-pentenoate hydratase/2-oxohepta-3-ene-1,7-dioic acid hydratase in catechol pathway
MPGDVIFTGHQRHPHEPTPPRYLSPGDRLDSRIEGIASMSHSFIAAGAREAMS